MGLQILKAISSSHGFSSIDQGLSIRVDGVGHLFKLEEIEISISLLTTTVICVLFLLSNILIAIARSLEVYGFDFAYPRLSVSTVTRISPLNRCI